MRSHDYEKLVVWQKSMDLVELVYKLTKLFPDSEIYGLSSQMRRCCVSIPSNIAEGSKRGTQKDFKHFLIISFSSGAELETQLRICKRLEYANEKDLLEVSKLIDEVMKMLNKLIQSII